MNNTGRVPTPGLKVANEIISSRWKQDGGIPEPEVQNLIFDVADILDKNFDYFQDSLQEQIESNKDLCEQLFIANEKLDSANKSLNDLNHHFVSGDVAVITPEKREKCLNILYLYAAYSCGRTIRGGDPDDEIQYNNHYALNKIIEVLNEL